MQDVTLTEEFLGDMPHISANAVKVHIVFRYLRNMSRAKYRDDYAWIRCGYEKISELSGVKHRTSVKNAIIELSEHGWISGFKRGGFIMKKKARVNVTNAYCIPDLKLEKPNESAVNMLKNLPSTRKGITLTVRKHLSGLLEDDE